MSPEDKARFEVEGVEGADPTAAEINALPDHVRGYIHRLETICDPAGDQRTLIHQSEQLDALQKLVNEQETAIALLISSVNRAIDAMAQTRRLYDIPPTHLLASAQRNLAAAVERLEDQKELRETEMNPVSKLKTPRAAPEAPLQRDSE